MRFVTMIFVMLGGVAFTVKVPGLHPLIYALTVGIVGGTLWRLYDMFDEWLERRRDERNYEESRERVVSEFLRRGGLNG